jgi:2-amino-4-hydroxy-6-hydroxymethyldihydropteridine diphosphokinase
VVEASRLYETEPWEGEPGGLSERAGWFLNCAVAIETTLPPAGLLERSQEIEAALGRARDPRQTPEAGRFAPRPLDIDILLYGDLVVSGPDDLQIPHLLMHERGFALRPLADLAPTLEHPTLYRTVRDLARDLDDRHEVRIAEVPPNWADSLR